MHFEVKVAQVRFRHFAYFIKSILEYLLYFQFLDAKLSDEDKTKLTIHEIRVGWSDNKTPLVLGETKFSYAFSSSGKKGR